MFKPETLRAFIEVVKQGSFTAAANQLNQTPMAMSKQVSNLEKQLAEPLLERSTRKLKLTQFGDEFIQQAKLVLRQHKTLDQWLESRTGKIKGPLKILTQANEIYEETIYPWIAEFSELYPELDLEFDINENVIDVTELQHDIYWSISDYLGKQHPGLKRRSLWNSQYGIFASPQYLKEYGMPTTPDELQHHKIIGYLHNKPNNVLLVRKSLKSTDENSDYLLLNAPIKAVTGLTQLAEQGLGLINAVVDNKDIKRLLSTNRLLPVLEDYWWPTAEVYIYYHQVKIEQAKVRAFIDFFISKRDLW
jgi:DNA-binding transcriptional LysR family regulator